MGFLFLTISLVFSIISNVFVKLSHGFKNSGMSILAFSFFGICIYFLTMSVQFLEVGIAYAIWSGVSIMTVSIIGITFFQESKSKIKGMSIVITIAGVLILQLQQ